MFTGEFSDFIILVSSLFVIALDLYLELVFEFDHLLEREKLLGEVLKLVHSLIQ